MPPSVPRRDALRLLGGLGLLALVPELGCKASSSATSDPLACVVRPELTEGPYFVDEKLDRSDIRPDPTTGQARPGTPLELTFVVQKIAGAQCSPLAGVMVDVWHCDASGAYSDVEGEKGKKYLRGFQTTGADGTVRFVTIFPGWYRGRAVHVHFKLRTSAGLEYTSQLFFDEAIQREVYASSAYVARGEADTANTDDSIYGDGGSDLLLTPTKAGDGYTTKIVIGLEV